MNERKLKVLEWNLHGMTGFNGKGNIEYYFPSQLIIENINRFNPDIIVFTEFCSFRFCEGWNNPTKDTVLHNTDDTKALEKWFNENNYTLKYSHYNDGIKNKEYNDVGIAIKMNEKNTTFEIEEKKYKSWPDYLGVCCTNEEYSHNNYYLMGVRIQTGNKKTDVQDKKDQFNKIIKEINLKKKEKPVIVLGDFNNGTQSNDLYKYMESECEKNDLHIYTPGVSVSGDKTELDYGVFSYAFGKSLMKIDHMITSFDAKVYDLNDRKQIGYDWGFIGDVYNNFRNYNKVNNSFRNIPDHAIFYAEITLPNNG